MPAKNSEESRLAVTPITAVHAQSASNQGAIAINSH